MGVYTRHVAMSQSGPIILFLFKACGHPTEVAVVGQLAGSFRAASKRPEPC